MIVLSSSDILEVKDARQQLLAFKYSMTIQTLLMILIQDPYFSDLICHHYRQLSIKTVLR